MPPEAGAPVRTVGVQVVLFDSDPAQQVRLAEALAATVRHARAEAGIGRVALRYGDCSRWPCLAAGDHERIEAAAGAGDGELDVSFRFFGANLGSGGGSNELAAAGGEDAVWVLNPDTHPAPTALAALLAALAVPGVGAAEARQIPIEHPKAYDPETGETGWASGACTLYRRAAFDAVGGFDARFFPLYCDDVDLSWRLRLAGWSIRHVPRAVVFHDKPISDDGAVRWSALEARSSHLARLWLYRRYERPDLEHALREHARTAGDPLLASAVEEFESRVAAGDAPEPIAAAETVAHFVDGQYAPRRFAYAG
jgi:GT2 family glycosyltransferase